MSYYPADFYIKFEVLTPPRIHCYRTLRTLAGMNYKFYFFIRTGAHHFIWPATPDIPYLQNLHHFGTSREYLTFIYRPARIHCYHTLRIISGRSF